MQHACAKGEVLYLLVFITLSVINCLHLVFWAALINRHSHTSIDLSGLV